MLRFVCFIGLHLAQNIKGERIQYFLIQAIRSVAFILGALCIRYLHDNWCVILVWFRMLIKLGAAPFHFWFIEIISSLSWDSFYLLATVQKILPLVTLRYFYKPALLYVLLAISVAIIGLITRKSFKLVLGYSSVNHIGWLIITLNNIWLILMFFLSYSLRILVVFSGISQISSSNISMFSLRPIRGWNNINIFWGLLRIRGFPPLIGFIGKLFLLLNSINSPVILVRLTLSSVIVFFSYIRLLFFSFIISENLTGFNSVYSSHPWWLILLRPIIIII